MSAGVSAREKFLVEFGGSGAEMEFGVEKYTYEIIYKNYDMCIILMLSWILVMITTSYSYLSK